MIDTYLLPEACLAAASILSLYVFLSAGAAQVSGRSMGRWQMSEEFWLNPAYRNPRGRKLSAWIGGALAGGVQLAFVYGFAIAPWGSAARLVLVAEMVASVAWTIYLWRLPKG